MQHLLVILTEFLRIAIIFTLRGGKIYDAYSGLRAIFSFGDLEIPSATTFCTPGICFAAWLHPLVISSLPSNLMARATSLSRVLHTGEFMKLLKRCPPPTTVDLLKFSACLAKWLVSRTLSLPCYQAQAGWSWLRPRPSLLSGSSITRSDGGSDRISNTPEGMGKIHRLR